MTCGLQTLLIPQMLLPSVFVLTIAHTTMKIPHVYQKERNKIVSMPIFDCHLQQLIAHLLIRLKEHIHISSGIIRKDFWTY